MKKVDLSHKSAWQEPELGHTQGQFMRAMAPNMAWHQRPPEADGTLELSDFMTETYARLVKVLAPPPGTLLIDQPLHLKNIDNRGYFIRHLAYRVLQNNLSILRGHPQKTTVEYLRNGLVKMYNEKKFLADTSHHPLFDDQRGTAHTWNGPLMRQFTMDRKEVKLCEHVFQKKFDDVAGLFPELASRSSGARIIDYAPRMRQELLRLISEEFKLRSYDYPTDDQKLELIDVVMDELISMNESLKLEEKAQKKAEELGIAKALDVANLSVLTATVEPERIRKEDELKEWYPVLQLFMAQLAGQQKTSQQAVEFAVRCGRKLQELKIPACDYPALSVATLLAMLRIPHITTKDITERLA